MALVSIQIIQEQCTTLSKHQLLTVPLPKGKETSSVFSPVADCTGFPFHSGSVSRAGSAFLDSLKQPPISDGVVFPDSCLYFGVGHVRFP